MQKDNFDGVEEVKVSITADELAAFLGIQKKQANGSGPSYEIDVKGGLISIIAKVVKDHERFKRERVGLKQVTPVGIMPFKG